MQSAVVTVLSSHTWRHIAELQLGTLLAPLRYPSATQREVSRPTDDGLLALFTDGATPVLRLYQLPSCRRTEKLLDSSDAARNIDDDRRLAKPATMRTIGSSPQ